MDEGAAAAGEVLLAGVVGEVAVAVVVVPAGEVDPPSPDDGLDEVLRGGVRPGVTTVGMGVQWTAPSARP